MRAAAPVVLDDADMDRLADSVAERLVGGLDAVLSDERIGIIADAVADGLAATFEVIADEPARPTAKRRRR